MGNSPSSPGKQPTINHSEILSDIRDWMIAVENTLIFVWCDASIGTQNHDQDQRNTIMQLAQLVNQNGQLVHTFNEIRTCQEFITHVNNVCLITSGSLGQDFVPLVHNFEQIHSIYIFCYDKPKHEAWAKPYQKIRGVFTDIRSICESLRTCVISRTLADHDRIEFDIVSNEINSPTLEKHELSLIHAKLSKIILLHMNTTSDSKQEMINYLRNEYTSAYQIQLINDFERNYSQHNPVWWFTRSCFFQGIINRALRTHDLYILCCMHRLIKDLDVKLTQLYDKQKRLQEPINLYFAQFLLRDDVQKLKENRGGLVSINQFISANSEESIAIMLLKQQHSSVTNGNKLRVLFQIYIDPTIQSNVAYANVASVSEFVHEKEYIISLGSMYRINKIEKLVHLQSCWLVQLTLIDRNDLQYNNLTQHIREDQIDEDIDLPKLGYDIQNRLHLFTSTNNLFKHALEHNKQAFRLIILHFNMAIIYDALGDFQKSLEEYRFVLNIARQTIPTCYQNDDLCLAPVYSNMGLTYEKKELFNHALEHAFRALHIVSKVQNESILKKQLESSCYFILGSIHDQEEKYFDARNFYERALRIREEYLQLGHPDRTALQRLITLISANKMDLIERVSF